MGDPNQSLNTDTASMFKDGCKKGHDRYDDNFDTNQPILPPPDMLPTNPLNFHRRSKYWTLMNDHKQPVITEHSVEENKADEAINMVYSAAKRGSNEFLMGLQRDSTSNQQSEYTFGLRTVSNGLETSQPEKILPKALERTSNESLTRSSSSPSLMRYFGLSQLGQTTKSTMVNSEKIQDDIPSDLITISSEKAKVNEPLTDTSYAPSSAILMEKAALSDASHYPKYTSLKKNKSFADVSQALCTLGKKSVVPKRDQPVDVIRDEPSKPNQGNDVSMTPQLKEHSIIESAPDKKLSLTRRILNWGTASGVQVSNKEMNAWAPMSS